jgi:hypothetical protein
MSKAEKTEVLRDQIEQLYELLNNPARFVRPPDEDEPSAKTVWAMLRGSWRPPKVREALEGFELVCSKRKHQWHIILHRCGHRRNHRGECVPGDDRVRAGAL